MEEAGAVLQAMEGGARLGFEVTKEALELIIRFVNFMIKRYERSKEFKMQYGDMNTEQKKRRNGYLSLKKMKKAMEETGDWLVPFNIGNGDDLTSAEMEKLEVYSKLENFPFSYIEEPVLDNQGNPILGEDGKPRMKKTFFCLKSDMDKIVIFTEMLNKDRQHEDIEKSDLSEEQKEQMHKEMDMEFSYEENEETVQQMAYDKTEFYEAMKQACKNGDFTQLESLIKKENIKFYSNDDKTNGFTAVMNKNARRDYAKGESYFVVDAKNPKRYVELKSEKNEKQNRTDTTYKVYDNDVMVFETDDKISDEVAEKHKGWNPNWNTIREKIALAGNFKEEGHYFVFYSEQEFSAYKEMFNESIKNYTINPEDISLNMDYAKAKADIIFQMESNDFYNANIAGENELTEIPMEKVEKAKLSAEQLETLGTMEKLDYQIFQNNMEQYATLNRLESIASSIEEKQMQLKELNLDNPIEAMEQNGKLNDEIASLKSEHDVYAKYLDTLAGQEKVILSSYAEEVTENKAKNKDASKLLNNFRANELIKKNNLDISGFNEKKQEEIKLGLAHGLSISQVKMYMHEDATVEDMKLSRVGLEKGLKNVQITHVLEMYKESEDFSLASDAITAYKAGLSKEEVTFAVDASLNSKTREQLIEACGEKVNMDLLEVIKSDAKNYAMKDNENLLTVRASTLLQIANKNITKEDMNKVCNIKNEESLKEIKNALDNGLSIKELEPVLKKDVTPEQVKGVADILISEKKEKSKAQKEKTPSKEQFKKAHEWAKKQNATVNKEKDISKETREAHRDDAR